MRILAIDYGEKKIGLALGDTQTKLAEPLGVVPMASFSGQILPLLKSHSIKKVVMGTPGGKIEKKIVDFQKIIEDKIGMAVELVDETLSTQEAQRLLIVSKKKRKSRQKKEDAFAAAVMLQYFLDRS